MNVPQRWNFTPLGEHENIEHEKADLFIVFLYSRAAVPVVVTSLLCDGSDALVFPCSEEELLYLDFMENVTDEILKLGLFSNRLEIFLMCMWVEMYIEYFSYKVTY